MKNFSKIQLLLLLCLFFGQISAQSLESVKDMFRPKEERAMIMHRKGVAEWKGGKIKKAKRYFAKAGKVSTEHSRECEMFDFYLEQGQLEKALVHLERSKCGDACDGIDKVREIASFGMIYGNLGKRDRAVENYGQALKLYKMYHLNEPELYSTLLNNYGVFLIYNQSGNGKNKTRNYRRMHQNDVNYADSFFQKAALINPSNCMAQFNLEVMGDLKGLSTNKNDGYLPDSVYKTAKFREIPNDCLPKDTVNKFLTIESEFVEASDLLIVMDFSGSMEGTKFDLMMETVTHLLDTTVLPKPIRIGILSVDGSCSSVPMLKIAPGAKNRDELRAALAVARPSGPTPLNVRLDMAKNMFPKGGKNRMIMLLTDGVDVCEGPSRTCAIADELKSQNIQVMVLTQLLEGNESYLNYATYSCLAENTHGKLLYLETKQTSTKKSIDLLSTLYNLPLDMKHLQNGTMEPFKPKIFVTETGETTAAR
jgi:Mg-chelatase subunit ChlD